MDYKLLADMVFYSHIIYVFGAPTFIGIAVATDNIWCTRIGLTMAGTWMLSYFIWPGCAFTIMEAYFRSQYNSGITYPELSKGFIVFYLHKWFDVGITPAFSSTITFAIFIFLFIAISILLSRAIEKEKLNQNNNNQKEKGYEITETSKA